jgi:hypothetical protein
MSAFQKSIQDGWGNDEAKPNVESLLETNSVTKSRHEAETLVQQLRSLTASELAGYVSSLISDNSRSLGTSVVELFQGLTPNQQKVTQSSLFAMERLVEVQKNCNIDDSIRCVL